MGAKLVFITVMCVLCSIEAYKILGVFPADSRSHYVLGSRLMKALAEKGHDVTIVAPYTEKNPPKGYREIKLQGYRERNADADDFTIFDMLDTNVAVMTFLMNFMGTDMVNATFANPEVQAIIHNPKEEFDVVIVEQFIDDGLKGLAYHFGAPLVLMSTIGSGPWVNDLVGNPAPRSYVADPLLNSYGTLSFWERTQNLLFGLFEYLNNHWYLFPRMNAIMHEYLPNTPSLDEINRNVSLVLLNSHVSTNQPVPHVPNMIEIGGFHVYPPKKLPQDLQQFLDEAKEGVVYFSLGSNVKSKELPEEKRNAILKVFSKLKEKVLWKFEDDVLPGQPPNVKIGKWLPQQDILAHPNVKAFITHGGLLSSIESVYHGVPLVGIPFFGDQKMNMGAAVANGYGIEVPFKILTEETLGAAVDEILNNPKYTENVKRRSSLMRDRPVSPIDSAIYWIEYVVRHKGAHHFRSAALDLTWYQYYLLDVLTVIFGSTVAVLYMFKRLFQKFVCKQSCAKVSKKKVN